MSGMISSIVSGLVGYFKDTVKTRTMKKADMEKCFRDILKKHETFVRQYNMISQIKGSLRNLIEKNNDKTVKANLDQILAKYNTVLRKCSYGTKALAEERKDIFLSLVSANKDMIDIVKEVLKNIDKILEEERADLGETRLSHVAVLGLMRRADILTTWSFCALDLFTDAYLSKPTRPFKYRMNFLLDHVEEVALMVAQIKAKQGPFMFLNDLNQMKNKNTDMVLGAHMNVGLLSQAIPSKIGLIDNILSALRVLNIFSHIGTRWDLYLHEKHVEDVEMCEWISKKIELLYSDMNGLDPNSPEYVKLSNIIEAYSERLSTLNSKIRDYEEGN